MNLMNSNTINQVSLIKNITLSSLNCQNFKSNILYAEKLVSMSDLTYLNELWLTPAEKPLLDSIVKNKTHNLLFNSDMNHTHIKGRPFGGQCWFIHSSFDIYDFKFINKNISYVHIRKDDFDCILIGTYMPFDDGKSQSKSEYELNISILSTILYNYKTIGISVLIVGDFNADTYRKKNFDNIFLNFINDYDLVNLTSLFCQEVNFTYKKKTK